MRQDSASPAPALGDLIDALKHALRHGGADDVDLAHEILVRTGAEPDIFAFVKGRSRKSVQETWGDNDRSYWAHVYPLPDVGAGVEYVLTLHQEGAMMSCLGVFPSTEVALKELGRHGKFESP